MAIRQIYVPTNSHIKIFEIEFEWFPGFSIIQKQKSVNSLHKASVKIPEIERLLEVSTKSEIEIGKAMSAFNLKIEKDDALYSLESIYQGSKKFRNGGPYIDIYKKFAIDAKKDQRLINSGDFMSYEFEGETWASEPFKSFYTWIYILGLQNYARDKFDSLNGLIDQLLVYDAFTDIEFNHKKSINCQAYSTAFLLYLYKSDNLEVIENKEYFIEIISNCDYIQGQSSLI